MTLHTLAQITNPVLPPSLGGGSNPDVNQGGASLGKLISNLVGALFIAGFLLTFMQLIIGGIQWITAGGDKQALEKARTGITNAIMGLVIVAATYAVMTLVGQFFGIEITNLTIPSFNQ
ncbi:MAG: hypothetical protein NT149_01740 [Candidatus Gottesmanbacteria bacterium]|nr:hypothetical protein [Candidatus Gottesmanbacteria bacterium]